MADKPKTVNAVALRDFRNGHADEAIDYASGTVIRDLPENQFNDWASIGLVRKATAEDGKAEAKA